MRPIPRSLLGILLVIVALLAVFPQFVERYYVQLAKIGRAHV